MKFKTTCLILFLALAFVYLDYTPAGAQVFLSNDTLRVVSVTAQPGDTAVMVSIYLRNTIVVAGFTLRIVYDSLYLSPNARHFVDPGPSHRAENMQIYDGNFDVPGVITFIGSGGFAGGTIPVGAGSILDLLFNVSNTAPNGTVVQVRFEDDTIPPIYDNALSDPEGINLYIPIQRNGSVTIGTGGGAGNDPPTIAAIPTQEVTEGQTVNFDVTATDPDGDFIVLTAQNLPAGATFPTAQGVSPVTSTFNFPTSLGMGPDTLVVTFRAEDDSGAVGTRNASIIIKEIPKDELQIISGKGGIPGKQNVLIPFLFFKQQSVYGFQFDMNYNFNVLTVDSFVAAPILSNFSIFHNLGDSAGFVTFLTFGLSGDTLVAGSDTVLFASVTIDTAATPGPTTVGLQNGKESISRDPQATSKILKTTGGTFFVDRFGDLNLDLNVDVQDAVSLVSFILGDFSISQRQQDVADINRDTSINVGDLVGVINTILRRPINTPPSGSQAPLASLSLSYDSLQQSGAANVEVLADLQVPVAGVQLEIKFDPNEISLEEPKLTERSAGFTVQYRKFSDGRIKLVMYNFSGKSISIGNGSILNIPYTINSVSDGEVEFDLEDVVLSDPEAVIIPTETPVPPSLPSKFYLYQNYPNPFNPATTIKYEISGTGTEALHTTLKIYNVLGQLVKTLVDEPKPPGTYRIIWEGIDERGEKVASGLYFYRLTAGANSSTKKMTLIK